MSSVQPIKTKFRTVADLLHLWPGKATERHLIAADDHEDLLCELIDGVLVEKAGGCPGSLVVTELVCHVLPCVKKG